jgi:hypothetical protein
MCDSSETAAEVRQRVAGIIVLADQDLLELMRSRAGEQEILDGLDEPYSASHSELKGGSG